jgi:RNA polymerase sigma-32 factor
MAQPHKSANFRADRDYVRQAMAAPLLCRERELALARRWREAGDEHALHALVTAYLRLVISAARRYRNYGLPQADLVQEGNVGLLQAAMRFEPERNLRFATYATWWVRAAMQDYVLRNWSIVRTGTTAAHKSLFFNLRRMRARLGREQGGGSPAVAGYEAQSIVARKLGVTEADVAHMAGRLEGSDRSLNVTVGEDGTSEWIDLLADDRPSPEDVVLEMRDGAARARWLERALSELSPREQTIIAGRRLRDEGLTLEALGRTLGISKERVRQIEHSALRKLRDRIADISGDRTRIEAFRS